MRTTNILRVAAVAVATACTRTPAPAAEAVAELAGGAVTLWTDSTELFMEHPALIVGAPDKFAVHLTDLTDFAPLRSGRITLTFTPRSGDHIVTVVQEEPRAPGIYGPSPTFTKPGVYDLVIRVESPQARDSLFVSGLTVYADSAAAPKAGDDAGAGISFLKEQQWKIPEFKTAYAAEGEMAGAFDAPGVLEAAAGRVAHVSAPMAGLIDAAGLSNSPVPGTRVARNQTLALLAPSLGEAGSGQYAEARARLKEAEDEHARAVRLYKVEAVPQRRVHEAEIRLGAAREALAGYSGGTLGADNRLAVRAPFAGVLVQRSVTPGGRVDAGALLFTIVDPSVLWLRVHVPAAQVSSVASGSRAEFRVEGSERAYATNRVMSVGSVVDSLSRSVPLLLQVANPDGSLKVGALARVSVRTGARERGVLIASSALLEEDGRPVVYVQVEGEAFERRDVVVGASERGRVLIRSGLRAGERVVTGAAYQVRLASLSTAVPAHGHEH